MSIEFKAINFKRDFSYCLNFRKDSYHCSFGILEGFEESVGENGALYFQKIEERSRSIDWKYIHVWSGEKIIGQLEFKSFSQKSNLGYVHLFYLIPEYRGQGLSAFLHEYVKEQLQEMGVQGAVLSVNKSNARAIAFYKKHHWKYLSENPKKAGMHFYRVQF